MKDTTHWYVSGLGMNEQTVWDTIKGLLGQRNGGFTDGATQGLA